MSWKDAAIDGGQLLDKPLFTIGSQTVTAFTIGAVLVVVAVTFVLSRGIKRAIRAAAARRGLGDDHRGSIAIAERVGQSLVLIVGGIIALQTVGIDLKAILATTTVFAIGAGLALQGFTQNLVSGIILLLERTIRPTDVIEVAGETVRVVELGFRSTRATSRDGEALTIPNSLMVQTAVKNLSQGEPRIRVRPRTSP